MRIAVFGATGGLGREIVKQALASGYEVVAYVRNPSKLTVEDTHLTIIKGELSDLESIRSSLKGANAVLSGLGPRGGSKGSPITAGLRNITKAMDEEGVRRLVLTLTISAKDPKDRFDMQSIVLVTIVRILLNRAYHDVISAAQVVRASDLDWTILRVSMPTDKPRTGKVRVGYLGRGELGLSVSRADLAEYMLSEIADSKYLRQSPAITN